MRPNWWQVHRPVTDFPCDASGEALKAATAGSSAVLAARMEFPCQLDLDALSDTVSQTATMSRMAVVSPDRINGDRSCAK